MNAQIPAEDTFHISPRFRQSIEARIARLEQDAATDECNLETLENPDHIRRHLRLVVVQRSEALRMRIFLERALHRVPRPLIGL